MIKFNRVVRTLLLFVVLVWAYPACAVVREGAVPGRSGLSFNNLTYRFNHLLVNIKNGTANNVIFGGTMVFLDRHYKPIARAELLPQHIKRRSTRKYRAVFVEGSGHEAAAAASLIWELDQRNN